MSLVRSLQTEYPALAKEWHPTKNGVLLPSDVSCHSNKKVWWKCATCGHEWQTTVHHRAAEGTRCPMCARKQIGEKNMKSRLVQGQNDLQTLFPDIAKEWDFNKNYDRPSDCTAFSTRKVWWLCAKGHSYDMAIHNRTARNSGCPYCANKRVLSGYNDLQTLFPEVAAEWHPTKNGDRVPETTAAHSNTKAWWLCKKGHEWEAKISGRTGKQHAGCPICSNRVVVQGYNDLLSNNPQLCKEWNYTLNAPLEPSKISATSPQKVWWTCENGHDYQAKVYDRNIKHHRCPYCQNQACREDYNSLALLNPALAKEWDYEKNYPLTPADVIYGGYKKYWWKCNNGEAHSYLASVNNRKKGAKCPYCSSETILPGFNDLATRNPDALALWDYSKNTDIQPNQVMAYSNKKVWWKCPDCGNEWHTAINLISSGTGCPKCASGYKVSESEHVIFYYIQKYFADAQLSYHANWLEKYEIDIYIPSIQIAIEYDGAFWHKSKEERDINKAILIANHGDIFVRFREEGLKEIPDNSFQIPVPTERYALNRLNNPLYDLFSYINRIRKLSIAPDIDVDRDWKKILANKLSVKKSKSLVVLYPEISKEWNSDRNEGLLPENFLPGSNKKVWWKCSVCGYEWEDVIANRTLKGYSCSRCNPQGHKLIKGKNDFATMRPDLLIEWNYEKNSPLNPKQLTVGSTKKVWWICSRCGNEWQSTIANRNTGYGCPICGKKRAAESLRATRLRDGKNSIATANPSIAAQWHPTKNGSKTPENTSIGSNDYAWWKCPDCGAEWRGRISSRKNAKGCPVCNNRRFAKGINDIFSRCPELRKEWDYSKNTDVDPDNTICSSPKLVWWKCSTCGNEWQTQIRFRYRGAGCQRCAARQAKKTKRGNMQRKSQSLADVYPDLAKEWHPTKNGEISPYDIAPRSGVKVWWKCSVCGYEWKATAHHRSNGTGCPRCANTKKNGIKIKNLETGEIFDSITLAAEKYSISPSAISTCLRGRTKKSGGYHWAKVLADGTIPLENELMGQISLY